MINQQMLDLEPSNKPFCAGQHNANGRDVPSMKISGRPGRALMLRMPTSDIDYRHGQGRNTSKSEVKKAIVFQWIIEFKREFWSCALLPTA